MWGGIRSSNQVADCRSSRSSAPEYRQLFRANESRSSIKSNGQHSRAGSTISVLCAIAHRERPWKPATRPRTGTPEKRQSKRTNCGDERNQRNADDKRRRLWLTLTAARSGPHVQPVRSVHRGLPCFHSVRSPTRRIVRSRCELSTRPVLLFSGRDSTTPAQRVVRRPFGRKCAMRHSRYGRNARNIAHRSSRRTLRATLAQGPLAATPESAPLCERSRA